MKRAVLFASALVAIGAAFSGASAPSEERAEPERLGRVSFPVSCNDAAQKEFNRAMSLFHSFWFDPAIQSFRKALQHDPGCGMAHWGVAIMSMGNPFGWPANPKAMQAAAAAMAEARRVGSGTERERDYIAALETYFEDWRRTDHRPRVLAFEKAMAGVAARYPDDDEAQILYALMLNATALPTDKTYANQLQAGRILEPLFAKRPDHPGVAHYLIHTYDYAGLAEKGLPAARAYARIAPSVPHALHMPSHIFSRVGLWREMVESNRASYAAAESELEGRKMAVGVYNALHAMDYLVFGLLQQARDEAARRVVDEVGAISSRCGESRRRLRSDRHTGPIRRRAERLADGGPAEVDAWRSGLEQVSASGSRSRLRPRIGRGANGRCGGRPQGRRPPTRVEASHGSCKHRLLAEPDGGPDQGARGLDRPDRKT